MGAGPAEELTMKTTLHRDGTVSFFSVTRQVRVVRSYGITDEDLAALPVGERRRIIRHLGL